MKELIKTAYLKLVNANYHLQTFFIKQEKNTVLFIETFSDNNTSIKKQLSKNNFNILEFDPRQIKLKDQLKMIKQAEVIIVDNYYVPFASLGLSKKKVIQIWHAAGAVKKFGLASPKNQKQKKTAIRRYKAVYNSFDVITVGSEAMIDVMVEAFDLEDKSKFLRSGYARSDYMYQNEFELLIDNVIQNNHYISDKYIILYMPTFRDSKIENKKQIKFLEQMVEALSDEFQVFYRIHPSNTDGELNINGAVEVQDNELMAFYKISNLIISDYSSVVFDAAIFNTPCAFYLYDYSDYLNTQGLFIQKDSLPGFTSEDANEIIKYILAKDYKSDEINEFDRTWNQYNSANSARRLVKDIFHKGE